MQTNPTEMQRLASIIFYFSLVFVGNFSISLYTGDTGVCGFLFVFCCLFFKYTNTVRQRNKTDSYCSTVTGCNSLTCHIFSAKIFSHFCEQHTYCRFFVHITIELSVAYGVV